MGRILVLFMQPLVCLRVLGLAWATLDMIGQTWATLDVLGRAWATLDVLELGNLGLPWNYFFGYLFCLWTTLVVMLSKTVGL
jgi:hypothetical protein